MTLAMRAMAHKRLGNVITVVIVVTWFAASAAGYRALMSYEFEEGKAATPPEKWPAQSKVARTDGLPAIVVLAHPKCPCTRATIEELAVLMTQLHGRATATVVFVRPDGVQAKWERTDLWSSAARIPGVKVVSDPAGVEAALFGAQASGQTLLYDAHGDLQFSGGITEFRGHVGDNGGVTAIESLVATGKSATNHTSVYGCSLHDPERAVKE
jgi:hypothetical protein